MNKHFESILYYTVYNEFKAKCRTHKKTAAAKKCIWSLKISSVRSERRHNANKKNMDHNLMRTNNLFTFVSTFFSFLLLLTNDASQLWCEKKMKKIWFCVVTYRRRRLIALALCTCFLVLCEILFFSFHFVNSISLCLDSLFTTNVVFIINK